MKVFDVLQYKIECVNGILMLNFGLGYTCGNTNASLIFTGLLVTTPHTFNVLKTTLFTILFTVLYTNLSLNCTLYKKLYTDAQMAG